MDNPVVQRLREVLTEKSARNPGFGLRALARQLGVPAATLSRILSGKRGLSLRMARKLVAGLCPQPAEQRRLLKAYALEPGRKSARPTRYRYLELAELETLSHWGYGALLEALRGEHGIRAIRTLALATGLSDAEAEKYLKDLKALKLVDHTIKRGWHTKGVNLSSIRWEGSAPWRKIHAGYAAQAVRYLERAAPAGGTANRDDTSNRDNSTSAEDAGANGANEEATIQGITFVAPPGRIAEAKQRIREFAEELSDDLAEAGAPILYRLNVQLFPLGKKPID